MLLSLQNASLPLNDELKHCIMMCLDCYASCEATTMHCLQMGGPHVEPKHLRLMKDCAEICRTSASFMLRNSSFHTQTCAVCADVCAECAQSCASLEGEAMQACAETCRRCAESCRKMAQNA